MKKNLRLLLGIFWMACVMVVAIYTLSELETGMISGSVSNTKLYPLLPKHSSFVPIFWSTALVAACWLLFGNEEN